MNKKEATGRVRVIKVPEGEIPWGIRYEWLGLILPCLPTIGKPDGELYRIADRRKIYQKEVGVVVPQDQAIEILGRKNPEMIHWWRAHGFPIPNHFFFFAVDEIAIVSGVTCEPEDVGTNGKSELAIPRGIPMSIGR